MHGFSFRNILTPLHFFWGLILVMALYAIFLATSSFLTLRTIDQAAPGHRVSVSTAPANLTVTLFYDYSCGFCIQIDPVIRTAVAQDGAVDMVFKFLPFFGERSEKMARLAYAAGLQEKFIQVHDYFINGGQRAYDTADITHMAQELGLNYDQLIRDSESDAAKDKIEENMALAMKLNIYATPTLLIGDNFFTPTGQMPDSDHFLTLFEAARSPN